MLAHWAAGLAGDMCCRKQLCEQISNKVSTSTPSLQELKAVVPFSMADKADTASLNFNQLGALLLLLLLLLTSTCKRGAEGSGATF